MCDWIRHQFSPQNTVDGDVKLATAFKKHY